MWKAVGIDEWLAGRKSSLEDARATVTEIIGRVQNEGDAALRDMAKKYCELDSIAVSEEEREAAYDHGGHAGCRKPHRGACPYRTLPRAPEAP